MKISLAPTDIIQYLGFLTLSTISIYSLKIDSTSHYPFPSPQPTHPSLPHCSRHLQFPGPAHQSYGHLQGCLGHLFQALYKEAAVLSNPQEHIREPTSSLSVKKQRHTLIPKHEMQIKFSTATKVFKLFAAQQQVSQKPASLRHHSSNSSCSSRPVVQASAQQLILSIWGGGGVLFLFYKRLIHSTIELIREKASVGNNVYLIINVVQNLAFILQFILQLPSL